MKKVFADTGYWIALLDETDDNHPRATQLAQQPGLYIFTSEMVLTELLTFFAGAGSLARQTVFQFVVNIKYSPKITIIPQTSQLFHMALLSYGAKADKKWSLTDCASFEIMKSKKISEALAYDKHFEQAGFVALLRSTL